MKSPASVAITVDLEDWHHGLHISPGSTQLEAEIDWLLSLFDCHRVRATFFTLGEVASQFPKCVRRIAGQGHEIGFHGATHDHLSRVGPEVFAQSLDACIPALEDLTGCAIRGYRAPFFSVTPQTRWALEILADKGFLYDASIYPGPNDRYGWRGAPATPVRHRPSGLLLFPVPMLHPTMPLAFSGGAYMRILPWWVIAWGLWRQRASHRPGMIYIHPWEVSRLLPWQSAARFRANLTRHLWRHRARDRFARLVSSLAPQAGTMTQVLSGIEHFDTWTPEGHRGDN